MPPSAHTAAPLVFAPHASRALGERIAAHLKTELAASEEREFENGEHKMRPLVNVRDRDVYVAGLLCGDAIASTNDKLCRVLFFIAALKDAGAARVTALVPFLPYARKDRRTKANDPIGTRYVATLFEAVGVDRIVVLDVHNLAAFENAYRVATVPLDASLLFADHFAAQAIDRDCVVASPDVGGVKRAHRFRDVLESRLKRPVGSAFMDKRRSGGVVSGDTLVGDVAGKRVLILDDLIGSGTTMCRAVAACRNAGALEVHLAATHPVFTPPALQLFEGDEGAARPDTVVVTDSVALSAQFQPFVGRSLAVLPIAPLLATAVSRLHAGESTADLSGL
jgi:ribose-phosphate pyrophosphokinase